MINENDKIEPGFIRFLQASPPPMVAGEYIIFAGQDIKNIPGVKTANGSFPFEKKDTSFHVSAPRFSLDTSEVYSVYPPASSTGDYFKTLPHVVFSRKTLPWERTIDGKTGGNGEVSPPWIALLLIDEDEIKEHDIKVRSVKLDGLTDPGSTDASVLLPANLNLEPWELDELSNPKANEDKRYNIVDLPLELFLKIVPNENELSFLAHARQVDTGNKEIAGINAKGWFSVIIGNRLPKRQKMNTVFLVSLEGHARYLAKGKPAGVDSGKKLRLSVLHYWSFKAEGLDFETLVDNLNKNIGPLKINPSVELPADSSIEKALHYGYTPINHTFRKGARAISWYRGPLVPVNISMPDTYRYNSPDGALRFDTDTGMFDISYAAAWQIGKLLALQAAGFSKLLNSWKNDYKKEFRLHIAREILQLKYPDRINFTGEPGNIESDGKINFSQALNKVESDDLMKNLVMELWNQMLNTK
jgi:hypothetical protein